MAGQQKVTRLNYSRGQRTLALEFDDGAAYKLTAEFLRVYSPSAEVRGHAPGRKPCKLARLTWVSIASIRLDTMQFKLHSMMVTTRVCTAGLTCVTSRKIRIVTGTAICAN